MFIVHAFTDIQQYLLCFLPVQRFILKQILKNFFHINFLTNSASFSHRLALTRFRDETAPLLHHTVYAAWP